MAKFVYRMQSILNLKLKTEAQAKAEFGIAKHALDVENDKLDALNREKEVYAEEGLKLRQDALKVREIINNRNYIEQLDNIIEEQKENIIKAENNLDVVRQKLTKEMQERKMQEKLREKAFDEYLTEEKEAEAVENDQRNSFVYGQKARNENS